MKFRNYKWHRKNVLLSNENSGEIKNVGELSENDRKLYYSNLKCTPV